MTSHYRDHLQRYWTSPDNAFCSASWSSISVPFGSIYQTIGLKLQYWWDVLLNFGSTGAKILTWLEKLEKSHVNLCSAYKERKMLRKTYCTDWARQVVEKNWYKPQMENYLSIRSNSTHFLFHKHVSSLTKQNNTFEVQYNILQSILSVPYGPKKCACSHRKQLLAKMKCFYFLIL